MSSKTIMFGGRRSIRSMDRLATGDGPVESRCGAVVLGLAYRFPALSVAGASLASPWLRFHIPLIKPGVRFSRTRLSDKAIRHMLLHTFAHEQSPLGSLEPV